ISLADQLEDILASAEAKRRTDGHTRPKELRDRASSVGWALAARIGDAEDLRDAVDALHTIPTDHAQRMLFAFGENESTARILLDQVWFVEYRRDAPDWARFHGLLQSIFSLAHRLDVPGLARAAAKLIVRVADEDLGEPDRALSLADELANELGDFP